MNRQVIDLMRGPLADRGGAVLDAPAVRTRCAEGRGFLESSRETFDLVQIPPLDAFGASGAGLYAAQESYLYTVEAFQAALGRLSAEGILSVTRWVRVPPRDGLKVFDTAAEALRRSGLDPAPRLAMIRSWATVTVLASRTPFGPDAVDALRAFAAERGFDLCYGPGVRADEVNRRHVLDRPYFYEGARALLGRERASYLAQYPFSVAAATDERPYFFHFFRWRSLPILQAQLGRRARAFLEVGYLMLLGALAQTVVLAAVLILGPLAPGAAVLRRAPHRGVTLAYFLLLGVGFMLLEIAFLQRLVLYLAHPIYSSAVVIAAFLVFAGVGSSVSRRWPREPRHVAAGAGVAVAVLALLTAAGIGGLLRPTQGWPMGVKMVVAAAAIAPLAFAMGHLMPTGLRLAGAAAPILVPWAWGVNGFASVAATLAAPLAAMAMGFSWVVAVAAGCYALAALGLGRQQASAAPP